MNKDSFDDRKKMTFEQAEGVEPLPSQLQLKEVSPQLRSLLWKFVYESMQKDVEYPSMGGRSYFRGKWKSILYDKHVFRDHLMVDDFTNVASALIDGIKAIFTKGDYVSIFGFLEYVLRHPSHLYEFSEQLGWALERSGAAYAILDAKTIVPISSEFDKAALEKAFADLAAKEFHGARNHLRNAGSHLTEAKYADSIRESMQAVESVARVIAPSNSFKESLNELEKSWRIHGGLKQGFLNIYGYTSNEKGLRHPLIDDPQAKVDEPEAMFMIGACAALVSYLINKARASGLLVEKD